MPTARTHIADTHIHDDTITRVSYLPNGFHFIYFQIEATTRAPGSSAGTGASLPVKSPLRGVDPVDRPVGPHDDGPTAGGRGGAQQDRILLMSRRSSSGRIREVAPAPDDDFARLRDCLVNHLVAFGPRPADGLLLGLH